MRQRKYQPATRPAARLVPSGQEWAQNQFDPAFTASVAAAAPFRGAVCVKWKDRKLFTCQIEKSDLRGIQQFASDPRPRPAQGQ